MKLPNIYVLIYFKEKKTNNYKLSMEIGTIIVGKVMVYYKSTDKYTHGHTVCSLLQFSDMLVCVCVVVGNH